MKRAVQILAVLGLVGLAALPARAIEVVEAWRSPFGNPAAVSVNSTDGSAWVIAASGIWHVAPDGTILSSTDTAGPIYSQAGSLSVNPTDGSCWAVTAPWDEALHWWVPEVVHLAADGTVLWRSEDLDGPTRVAVNPTDGSCWVIQCTLRGPGGCDDGRISSVAHLAPDGTMLRAAVGFNGPQSLSVDASDGSVWVSDPCDGDMVHLSADAIELWRGPLPGCCGSISANSADGSCWVGGDNKLWHLAADGTMLLEKVWPPDPGYYSVARPSVNPTDGSCWTTKPASGEVVHVAEDGTELLAVGGFDWPRSVSVNPTDGSCWVVDGWQVAHLAEDGAELWRLKTFAAPSAVSVNSADASCWVADSAPGGVQGEVAHLSETGVELWRGSGLTNPSVNPTDNSCWALAAPGCAVHLAEDGTELVRAGEIANCCMVSTSVNPTDGSCWVTSAAGSPFVMHLAEDGSELWRTAELGSYSPVSVDSSDGSCWLTTYGTQDVVHLSADGSELWRGNPFGDYDYGNPQAVSVNSRDSSCWVLGHAEEGTPPVFDSWQELVHLAPDGTVLWRSAPLDLDWSWWLAANPADGTCWVGREQGSPGLLLIAEDGTELWRGLSGIGGSTVRNTRLSPNPTDGSCWVADGRRAQFVHLVIPGWKPSLFYDVPWYHWAFDYVGACFNANIVAGYTPTHYRPTWAVTRDQMAVYISRGLVAPSGDAAIPPGPPEATFSDVPTDHWAFKWVEYAFANSIVGGYWDGTYRPTNPVDRGQMAVFIARAIVTPHGDEGLVGYTPPETPTFSDVATDHWAYKYIEYIAQDSVAVSQGYGDGTYRPAVIVTRDQMAVYVQRAFALPL